MQRTYAITLNFKVALPNLLGFMMYVPSSDLFVPESIEELAGSISAEYKDGRAIVFNQHSLQIYVKQSDALEAIKDSLEKAKEFESKVSVTPALSFNPNLIIITATDSEGKYLSLKDLEQDALKLQRRLYIGGNVTGYELSEESKVFLGIQEEIDSYGSSRPDFEKKKIIIKSEGTAQSATSLDELLQRLEQKPQ